MSILDLEVKISEIEMKLNEISLDDQEEIEELQQQLNRYKKRAYQHLTAWDHVTLARHSKRPKARDYIEYIFDSFIELHGDRLYRDDEAIIGGIAKLGNQAVTVIAHQKGCTTAENIKCNFGMPHPEGYRKALRLMKQAEKFNRPIITFIDTPHQKGCTTAENIKCNFGMPHPEGYRKALRLMKQAEKFNRPIITFIDTPGAYPGPEAEERGQGHAIAECLREMSNLTVPTLSIVIGEGGSGGALALGVSDEIWMLEYAIYSILSPEGFASILYKDGSRAQEAAEVMKLTAKEYLDRGIIEMLEYAIYSILSPEGFASILYKDGSRAQEAAEVMKLTAKEYLDRGIIEKIIKEPIGGAHQFPQYVFDQLKEQLNGYLSQVKKMTTRQLLNKRYKKYRLIGEYDSLNR